MRSITDSPKKVIYEHGMAKGFITIKSLINKIESGNLIIQWPVEKIDDDYRYHVVYNILRDMALPVFIVRTDDLDIKSELLVGSTIASVIYDIIMNDKVLTCKDFKKSHDDLANKIHMKSFSELTDKTQKVIKHTFIQVCKISSSMDDDSVSNIITSAEIMNRKF